MTPEAEMQWTIVTVLCQILAASGLSFCLARTSFWRIDRKSQRSEIHHRLQEPHLEASDLVGTSQTQSRYVGISSFLSTYSLKTDFGRFTPTNYVFITTFARFAAFLTLLSALLFVICFAVLSVALSISPQLPEQGTAARIKDESTCMALIFICIGLYAITRIFVYMFFFERVYLVRCGGINVPRLSTTTYRGAVVCFAVYSVIMVLLVIGRISNLQPSTGLDDGSTQSCIIGTRLYALVPFFLFDLLLNSSLTIALIVSILNCDKNDQDRRKLSLPICFLRKRKPMDPTTIQHATGVSTAPPEVPASQFHPNNAPSIAETDEFASWQDLVFESSHSSLRKLAVRSLIASLVGLVTSCINVSVWIAHRGVRESMTCMRWCFVDVVVNAFAVAAVMHGRGDETWWQNALLRPEQTPVYRVPSNEDSIRLAEVTARGRARFAPNKRLGDTSLERATHTRIDSAPTRMSVPRGRSRTRRGTISNSEGSVTSTRRCTLPSTRSPLRRLHFPLMPKRHAAQPKSSRYVEDSGNDDGEVKNVRQYPRWSLQSPSPTRSDPRRWSSAE